MARLFDQAWVADDAACCLACLQVFQTFVAVAKTGFHGITLSSPRVL
jgi:hypothetical protein